jgi:hypothetical protein
MTVTAALDAPQIGSEQGILPVRSGAAGIGLGCSRKRHSFADGVDPEDSCRDPLAGVCPAPAVASARLSGPRPLSANVLQVCPLASLQTRFNCTIVRQFFQYGLDAAHGMSGQAVSMAGPAGDQQRGPDRDGGCRPADHVDGSQRQAPCGEAAGEAGASVQERPPGVPGRLPSSFTCFGVGSIGGDSPTLAQAGTTGMDPNVYRNQDQCGRGCRGHPRLSKTPRSGLNRDRTHRGQKMAPLQRKSMASLSARSKE